MNNHPDALLVLSRSSCGHSWTLSSSARVRLQQEPGVSGGTSSPPCIKDCLAEQWECDLHCEQGCGSKNYDNNNNNNDEVGLSRKNHTYQEFASNLPWRQRLMRRGQGGDRHLILHDSFDKCLSGCCPVPCGDTALGCIHNDLLFTAGQPCAASLFLLDFAAAFGSAAHELSGLVVLRTAHSDNKALHPGGSVLCSSQKRFRSLGFIVFPVQDFLLHLFAPRAEQGRVWCSPRQGRVRDDQHLQEPAWECDLMN